MGELFTKAQILEQQIRYGLICGIYFLIEGDEIVYVGQSRDILARIGVHHREGEKVFSTFFYIRCEVAAMADLEADYIVSLAPRYNTTIPVNTKWTIASLLRRRTHEAGIHFNDVKRYIRERKISLVDEQYYRIADFADLFELHRSRP